MLERIETDWLDSPEVLKVTFHPRKESGIENGAKFESLDIPVADGVTVGGRFYAVGTDAPTVLFFHGNGEIVADYAGITPLYEALGANFLPVDYRGYGRSSGQPAIRSMLLDARTVFTYARDWLQTRGYDGPIVVMGRSLGSASALEVASAHPEETAALIIDSGFSDTIGLLVRLGAPRPPADFNDVDVQQSEKIAAFGGLTLIIHGTHDSIIPLSDAEALFRSSQSKTKRLVKIEGAGHNNLLALGMRQYSQALAELLSSLKE